MEEIRNYLLSAIQDKAQFIRDVLAGLEKGRGKSRKTVGKTDLQKKIKQLRSKKEKYQEMYAADVMTMAELKEKSSYINKELEALTKRLEQTDLSDHIEQTSDEQIRICTEKIEGFLSLENVTNGDLRKIISRIVVNRDGEIKVYLRKFSDFMMA